jgi:hypothetical protein
MGTLLVICGLIELITNNVILSIKSFIIGLLFITAGIILKRWYKL